MRKLVALLFFSASLFAQTIPVPEGKPIMLDGKISRSEWSDAKELRLGTAVRLLCKQNNHDVLMAIEFVNSPTGTVDLYLSASGSLYDLHASAKLGERKLVNGVWPEEWNWWNNEQWVANVSRPDDWGKRTFKDEKVREFQISRSRFPGKSWKVFFEWMTPAESGWKTTPFPPEANNRSDKNWLVLQLD
ncbi:MAG TPA: hypothetical protein VN577_22245 [Terriglobales bacterium]|nr:hypothetical protein [Terriglobales bacterium]